MASTRGFSSCNFKGKSIFPVLPLLSHYFINNFNILTKNNHLSQLITWKAEEWPEEIWLIIIYFQWQKSSTSYTSSFITYLALFFMRQKFPCISLESKRTFNIMVWNINFFTKQEQILNLCKPFGVNRKQYRALNCNIVSWMGFKVWR